MKNFLFTIIAMPTILTTSHLNAMGSVQPLQQAILKTCAQLMTTAHWIISARHSIQSGINRVTVTTDENTAVANDLCIEANTQVNDFITSELRQIIPKKNIATKINPILSANYPITSLNNHILIAQYVADEITQALKNNDQTTLNKWRAVMQHEATHIKNNDLFWRSIADFTTPIITHALFQLIWHLISSNTKRDIPLTWPVKQYLKIITAIYKFTTTHYIRMAIYRYQEKIADNGIANDINLLNGMKSFLNDIEQIIIKNHGNISPIEYKLTRWINNFAEEHPLISNRIKKLDQRIALLEKQSLSSMSNNS